ncbi:hypothetical protein M422DRAFT_248540 [Sphaerobolus stellatus SS14]|uniref:Uncharacterized protein n=1 Tax=Sphaerobolus stellatus (strain SS14) TaxID=990650 RepID=A0A0C9W4S0_SPHS4|nr:hypothetical protein M422DRAFT_248540 [Sphaerobolus stellatus SS14]
MRTFLIALTIVPVALAASVSAAPVPAPAEDMVGPLPTEKKKAKQNAPYYGPMVAVSGIKFPVYLLLFAKDYSEKALATYHPEPAVAIQTI